MNHRNRILSATLLGLVSATAGAAPRTLEQIIVTGSRTEQAQFDSPASISVITREQIEKSGALTIADVLRARAGIQVRDTIGDGGRGVVISMRGFGENAPNNTLILVDGRRLNNPTLQAPDLNSIALKDIERIEVLAGGGGVLYGDQAVGGVINVVTRDAGDARLDVNAGAGSHDGNRVSLVTSRRLDNGVGVRLSAEHREADNYRDNNASEYANVLGLVEYKWNGGRVFAEAQHTDDNLELPGAISTAQERSDRRQSQYPGSFDFSDTNTRVLRTGGRYALTPSWSVAMELTERKITGDAWQGGPSFGAANTSEMRVRSANPRLIGEFDTRAGKSLLTIGYDATDSDYLLDIPAYFFSTDFRQEQRDAYAQLQFPIVERVQATIGARRAEVDDHNKVTTLANGDGKTVTTLSLAWQFRDDMRLLARRDEVLRYPTVDENGFTLPGVTFLRPQTGVSLETALEWFGGPVSGRIALFDLTLDDEILYDPSAPGPGAAFGFFGANINLDSSERRGALLEWRWQALERLELAGSYTYTHAEITAGTFDGREVPFVAKHVGAVSATWDIGQGFSAFTEFAYSGTRQALGDDAGTMPRVGSEGLLNAALRWERPHWNAALRVNNLGGAHYDTLTVESFGRSVYPAPGRTVFMSVGYTL